MIVRHKVISAQGTWAINGPACAPVDTAAGGAVAGTAEGRPAREGGVLMLFDIDDLAGLNRSLGYDVGDRLLNRVEDVIRRSLPDRDIRGAEVGRLDGGRILAFLPGQTPDLARPLAEHMRTASGQAYVESVRGPVSRTLSVGMVEAPAGVERGRLILHAGTALTRAKSKGGNRLEVSISPEVALAANTEQEVRTGIESGAISYHAQPIVALETGAPVGIETLLRWVREDGETTAPDNFVDTLDRIPEKTASLFAPLAQAAIRPFLDLPSTVFVTLNLSGASLDGLDTPGGRWLRDLLKVVPPERVVVEIIESAVMVHPEKTAEMMTHLRSMGVRVALDDFGAGLSNLDRLHRLPVDFVKIDKQFVRTLGTGGREEAILQSLVCLARALDFDLIAEGIETEDQARIVRDIGIRYGQGFLYGRPDTVESWAAQIAASPPPRED